MVYSYRGHDTIEEFWEKYVFEFQDIYDRFSLWSVSAVDCLQKQFGFADKTVLDIGTGTGLTAFRIARHADMVVSIDPYPAMLNFAIQRQAKLGIKNVKILEGHGEDLSRFAESEFDYVISVAAVPILHADLSIRKRDATLLVAECGRVTKKGGHIIFVSVNPAWRWDHLMDGKNTIPDPNAKGEMDELLDPCGFSSKDIMVVMDYGSVEEALATYGFIYGPKAIDYILDNRVSRFNWSIRFYVKKV